MKSQTFLFALFLGVAPLLGIAGKTKLLTLQFEFSRAGLTVCKGKKEVQDGETFLFCEGKALGNRALVKVKAKILPKSKEAEERGHKFQVDVSATVEEIEPSGRIAIVSTPQIIALEGEQAEFSVSETPEDGQPVESFSMKVTPIIPN